MEKNIEQKLDKAISYIFGNCDMRKGEKNQNIMLKVKKYCMNDIKKHPSLEKVLKTNYQFSIFVIQSMIYMLRKQED